MKGVGKPRPSFDPSRRDFLVSFCQGAGATLIPKSLWGLASPKISPLSSTSVDASFYLHPHYRIQRPLDDVLSKVTAGLDEFVAEKYAEQIEVILAQWSADMLRSPAETGVLARMIAEDFSGSSPLPIQSRTVRSNLGIEVNENKFADQPTLNRDRFLRQWQSRLGSFSQVVTAEFQITRIEAPQMLQSSELLRTRVRYEIVGTGSGFHREQRVGEWDLEWKIPSSGDLLLSSWRTLQETQARSKSPIYADIAAAALAGNSSYSAQLLRGTDYWRTVLDGASGIDIYGHNGISVADIDNDGFDDLYVCQPAGLPNRLYRNRGDGTFDDITESSGLGILENTACALFADFNNHGRQDVIVVRASGPVFFVNDGGGKFHEHPDAFRFANPPQGTFTGAAVADYDRDGWLDIYFCLYAYYQGTGQYKYPSPYHDAQNGPPNFLMRNQRDGTFRDATAESGLNQNNTRYSFCCGWGDYNRNGWPDLFVVNDFGRKNLYRNNGDGTFTDIAAQAGVEDVGAGMSLSWLDYNGDEAADLYSGNMWTAPGERISTQEIFKKDSPGEIRRLYQKHAMGNSLFLNRGLNHDATFEDTTNSAHVGMGRWSWSSDALDFDHDGFPDLYIANGMVSGLSRHDLNSFFWRQVVARSPDDPRSSQSYEQGWNAINELIRSDGTWSGYERNVFYANNRDGTFSDVSAAVGIDFVEDGRAFALTDFDHDGRLELFLKNRNAPQLRLLKNVVDNLPPSISFRLQGTKSNRDAIGASITIETNASRRTQTLQAGSGFLSQHGKDLFFGLGDTQGSVRATIQWPSGVVQKLDDLPVNHRVWVVEGSQPSRLDKFESAAKKLPIASAEVPRVSEQLPDRVETWLLSPIAAPEFSLPDGTGTPHQLSSFHGKLVLLSLCVANAPAADKNANVFLKNPAQWVSRGLQPIIVMDDTAFENSPGCLVLRGSDDFFAIYNILYRQLFDRHRDLSLPTSFLIDANGDIVKVYQYTIDAERVEKDLHSIPKNDAERLSCGLPFPSATHRLNVGRNYLSYGAQFFQRGYLDQAEASFQRAFRDDPSSAEALYGIGSVYLNQNKNAAAREVFERTVKLRPNYPDTLPDAWNNLGVIATREGRSDDSVRCFQAALQVSPHHLLSLDNLGNAYRLQKNWGEARKVLEQALEIAPSDPEANYSLAMVFAQADDTARAYEYLQRALKARPIYPEALNNLGVLFLNTQRRDQAVASFEECIRVAPAFDQAYLNLARVYALEGTRDKARSVLLSLLKLHPDHPQAKQMLEQLQ